ncbi:glucoside xylosyltransferase 1 isoform X2 [Planococcus citri]|uniref:glucoside xylosyltransferase 1 isoform X2 n=1 Tax=Planococcus citri TaxID=170843 RepID=UPI0031F97419
MRLKRWFLLVVFVFVASMYVYLLFRIHLADIAGKNYDNDKNVVSIALVICGSRSAEALVMMKSAIVFQTTMRLQFLILSEFHLQQQLQKNLDRMKLMANNSFTYRLLNLSFPTEKANEWRYLFQPCATQRLFLPDIIKDLDSVLYVDTDVLFLNELSDIWGHFEAMNSSQMSALVPEHEDANIGWYNRFARHPYYGKLGVNSGVMLMNLTRMRQFNWVDKLEPILSEFKSKLTWGDQDIINIIFHYHPDKLYVYACRYNYRTDHCMYKNDCDSAQRYGVSVIHGSRGAFYSDKQSTFKAIFATFSKYELGKDPMTHLAIPMKRALEKTKHTRCGALIDVFLNNMMRIFSSSNVDI